MASEMQHFPDISYVSGDFRVHITFDRFSQQFQEAQQWLGDRVLEDSKSVMPLLTGSLQDRSHVEEDGRRVVFPGPYARYLYMGNVMVDSVTGKGPMKIRSGPGGEYILRFRKGAHLVPTDRKLTYSRAEATDHWFDTAKAQYGEYWIQGVKKLAGGGG